MLRREVILGGALTILWSVTGCPCSAQTISKRRPGCTVDADEAQQFFQKANSEILTATGTEPVVPTSGDRDFDYALAHTLSRMTDVFGVLPGFGYYDDAQSPNAYATPAVRMQSADGTVLFGRRLLRETLAEREHPDVGVSAVCAHEYAHILQYKMKLMDRLQSGQPTVKRIELHADYLAGFFAGVRKLQKSDYPAAVYATKAHSIGDFMFTDRNHHGTPDERAAAIVAGFNASFRERKTFAQGIETGLNYVQSVR